MSAIAARLPDAQVDVRLAKADRQELRVAVGEVQETDVSEGWQVVQRPAVCAARLV